MLHVVSPGAATEHQCQTQDTRRHSWFHAMFSLKTTFANSMRGIAMTDEKGLSLEAERFAECQTVSPGYIVKDTESLQGPGVGGGEHSDSLPRCQAF